MRRVKLGYMLVVSCSFQFNKKTKRKRRKRNFCSIQALYYCMLCFLGPPMCVLKQSLTLLIILTTSIEGVDCGEVGQVFRGHSKICWNILPLADRSLSEKALVVNLFSHLQSSVIYRMSDCNLNLGIPHRGLRWIMHQNNMPIALNGTDHSLALKLKNIITHLYPISFPDIQPRDSNTHTKKKI